MRRLFSWFKTGSSTKPATSRKKQPPRTVLQVEALENRLLMANNLAALVAPLDSRLSTIDSELQAAINSTSATLPILNQPLSHVTQVLRTVDQFRSTLVNAVSTVGQNDNLVNDQAQNAIRDTLFTALNNAGVLGDTNGDGTVNSDDVLVSNVDLSKGTVTVEVRLTGNVPVDPNLDMPFKFGLGLPGVPFQVTGGGSFVVSAGFDYQDLKFGLDTNPATGANEFFFDTSGPHQFKVGVDANLQNLSLNGQVGFLNMTAQSNNNGPTHLHGDLTCDVVSTDRFTNDLQIVNPHLGGGADVNLTLTANFGNPTSDSRYEFPSIATDFYLHWGFDNTATGADAAVNQGAAPTVQFNKVRVSLGEYLSRAIEPIVTDVQTALAPLKPVMDVLNARIPGLSDLAGSDVNLIELAKGVASTGLLSPDIKLAVELGATLHEALSVIADLKLNAGDVYLPVGSFQLSGPNNQTDLRQLASLTSDGQSLKDVIAGLGNNADLTQLIAVTGERLQSLGDRVLSSNDVPQSVKDALAPSLARLSALNNGIKLEFPLIEDPAQGVFKLLLGQHADIVTLTAQFNFDNHFHKDYPLYDNVSAFADGDIHLRTYFKLGYDTYGLVQLFHTFNPASLANGFYIDSSQPLVQFSGSINVGVEGTLPVYVFWVPTPFGLVPYPVGPAAELSGGLSIKDFSAKINDPNGDGHFRPFENVPNQLFTTNGTLNGELKANIVAKTPVPYIPDVVLYTKPFVSKTFFDFAQQSFQANPFLSNAPGAAPALPDPADIDLGALPFGNDGVPDRIKIRVLDGTFQVLLQPEIPDPLTPNRVLMSKPFDLVNMVDIKGSNDDDIITIDGSVNRAIQIDGRGGNNTLIFDDSNTTDATEYTIKPNQIEAHRDAGDAWIDFSNFADVTLKAGQGYDHVSVEQVNAGTHLTLVSGNGGTTFELGSSLNDLSLFNGDLTITPGSGYNELLLDDQASADWFTSYVVTANKVQRYAEGDRQVVAADAPLIYSEQYVNVLNIGLGGFDTLVIQGSQNTGTRFEVRSKPWHSQVRLYGGPQNDTYVLGSAEEGRDGLVEDPALNGVDTVDIEDAGGDHNVLVVDDQGSQYDQLTQSISYKVTDTDITRTVIAGYQNEDGIWVDQSGTSVVNTRGMAEVHLIGMDAAVNYTIESTAANQKFTLHTGSSRDSVVVGNDTNGLDGLQSPVTLEDAGGADTLVVKDQANPYTDLGSAGNVFYQAGTRGYHLNSSLIAAGASAAIYYSGYEKVTLNTGNGANSILVDGTAQGAAVTINGGNGNDQFVLGGYDLNAFQGPLTVNGGLGNDTVKVYDQLSAPGQTYTVTGNQIARSGIAPITYNAVEDLELRTSSNAQVTVGGNQDLGTIQGTVAVHGGSGTTLALDDSRAQTGQTYILSAGQLSRSSAALIPWDSMAQVTLTAGQGDDVIDVVNTAAATPVTLIGGPGNDTINVGYNPTNPASLSLDGIQGTLTIQDAAARPAGDSNTVNIYDQGNTTAGQNYLFGSDRLLRDGAAPIIWGTKMWDTWNVYTGSGGNHVTVNGGPGGRGWTEIYGGAGNDVFDVLATNPLTYLEFYGNGGNDLFRVGSASTSATDTAPHGGALAGVQGGVVRFTNAQGSGTVVLDDSGDSAAQSATLAPNQLQAGTITQAPIAWAADKISFYGGSGGNNLTLGYDGVWEPVEIFAGSGNDTINVSGTPAGNPYWYPSPSAYFTLHGQGGNDTVIVNDQNATDNPTWSISGTAVTRTSHYSGFSYDSVVTLNYDGVENLAINAGSGNNTFALTSPSAALTLDGGSGVNTVTGSSNLPVQLVNTLRVAGWAVTVDITALGLTSAVIDGVTLDLPGPTALHFLPGRHWSFLQGVYTYFTVNADGTLDYDASLQGALTGRGTTSLSYLGRAVTVDITALGLSSAVIDGVTLDLPRPTALHFLPGRHWSYLQNVYTYFTVNADGTLDYDASLEGALTGRGTTTLTLAGRPVTLDLTALGQLGSTAIVDGVAQDLSRPATPPFLPGQHNIYVGGVYIFFTVKADGTIDYDASLDGKLAGRGTTTLVMLAV
jgi:hypothetical protein